MKATHPNRLRQQVSHLDQILHKKSGDQHLEPQDEPADSPHRPHRVNREDMQKLEIAPPQNEEE